MNQKLRPVGKSLLVWSENERSFLDLLLDEGGIDATLLHHDHAVQDRVQAQPMLQWKAQNVREYRGDRSTLPP